MTGADIRRFRNYLGLSQDALGRLLGVNNMTIYRWETGITKPQATAGMLASLVITRSSSIVLPPDFSEQLVWTQKTLGDLSALNLLLTTIFGDAS